MSWEKAREFPNEEFLELLHNFNERSQQIECAWRGRIDEITEEGHYRSTLWPLDQPGIIETGNLLKELFEASTLEERPRVGQFFHWIISRDTVSKELRSEVELIIVPVPSSEELAEKEAETKEILKLFFGEEV
jgi:hypothetical protein